MAELNRVAVNGDVYYYRENGDWDHAAGVHINSTPKTDRPIPTDNQMSWTEGTRDGTKDSRATITSMEETGDMIKVQGNCTSKDSKPVEAGHSIVMTIYVHKTGGQHNNGEAAVTYDESVPTIFQPFSHYSTIHAI